MSFEKKIASKSDSELIEIIENRDNYVFQFVEFAEFELTNRNLSIEEVKEIATKIVVRKIEDRLQTYSPLSGKFNIPISFFLSEQEVLELTKPAFEAWIARKEDFGFDVWKYAIGGIL